MGEWAGCTFGTQCSPELTPGPKFVDSVSTVEQQMGVCRHTVTVHRTQAFAAYRGVKAAHLPSGSFWSLRVKESQWPGWNESETAVCLVMLTLQVVCVQAWLEMMGCRWCCRKSDLLKAL